MASGGFVKHTWLRLLTMVTATVAHNDHNDNNNCNDHDEDKTTNHTTNDCTKVFWVVCSGGAHNEDSHITDK